MAVGWARDGAVEEQIEATINDELARIKQRQSTGESRSHCEDCGDPIPEKRREVVRGVRFCLPCQQEFDARPQPNVGINRRGSKDSQLK